MLSPASLARWEGRVRPLLARLPAALAVRLYSRGRARFSRALASRPPRRRLQPKGLERELWGLRFQSPLLNAAGMFKAGDGYGLAAAQGAGAFLAGTTTGWPRGGNYRFGIFQPFAPYPSSGAASNWLGLPNPGHRAVAQRLAEASRQPGCPLGASVAADPDPDIPENRKLEALVEGMLAYEEAGVDFLEMNESCPNTEEGAAAGEDVERLVARLEAVAREFLAQRSTAGRSRALPVIVKFSCDTQEGQVADLLRPLIDLGFDGVNFGNTSTAYERHAQSIAAGERPLFRHFTKRFGGGLSGRPLAADSLSLVRASAKWLDEQKPEREFRVIRTGGVEGAEQVVEGLAAGASLCQWYTGYFEALSQHGHGLYTRLYDDLRKKLASASATG